MAEEKGKVVVYPAFSVVQVRVADAARLYGDERLARTWVRHENGHHLDRCPLLPGHDAPYLVNHQCPPCSSPCPLILLQLTALARR